MFKRTGTPEPMQTLKFKCRQCQKEALILNNGLCSICASQQPIKIHTLGSPEHPATPEEIEQLAESLRKEKEKCSLDTPKSK